MQIGQAAAASGVSAKMIRHYETIGLVPKAGRRASNYRDYAASDVHRLQFIRRARSLGFSFDQIRSLLSLWGDRRRSNAKVKQLALKHARALEDKARLLNDMAAAVRELADACEGDGRPECPILKTLEGGAETERAAAAA